MHLHHQLRVMVERLGPHASRDADQFRAALDDSVDEPELTKAQFNLLVDAVRLDAFDHLSRMIAAGAAPSEAVVSAGDRLAGDRGSPRDAAHWACAVLGYAAGWVPESEVGRFAPLDAPPPDRGDADPQVPHAVAAPPRPPAPRVPDAPPAVVRAEPDAARHVVAPPPITGPARPTDEAAHAPPPYAPVIRETPDPRRVVRARDLVAAALGVVAAALAVAAVSLPDFWEPEPTLWEPLPGSRGGELLTLGSLTTLLAAVLLVGCVLTLFAPRSRVAPTLALAGAMSLVTVGLVWATFVQANDEGIGLVGVGLWMLWGAAGLAVVVAIAFGLRLGSVLRDARPPSRWPVLVTAVGIVTLAVVAPLLPYFDAPDFTIDGWGRVSSDLDLSEDFHGVRYGGILLSVVALGNLAVVARSLVAAHLRPVWIVIGVTVDSIGPTVALWELRYTAQGVNPTSYTGLGAWLTFVLGLLCVASIVVLLLPGRPSPDPSDGGSGWALVARPGR